MPVTLAAASSEGGSSLTVLLPIAVIAVIGYFALIRPQRNRQRKAQQMQSTVEIGANVMTTAGLFATVVDVDDEAVTLEVAPGVHSRYLRAAVAKVIPETDDAVLDEGEQYEDEPVDEVADPTGVTNPTRPSA